MPSDSRDEADLRRYRTHGVFGVHSGLPSADVLETMRIIVFGSRGWTDREAVLSRLLVYIKIGPCIIVHGNCPTGADYYAELAAIKYGCEVERFTADWDRYGRKAGPMRNAEMVAAGANIALGFRHAGRSDGTDGMRRLLDKAGIFTELYGEGWK